MSVHRISALLLLALIIGAESIPGQSRAAERSAQDPRIQVSGAMTNLVFSGRFVAVTLYVTNMSGGDLYVPRHFNSNNYSFQLPGGRVEHYHGDSWAATLEDFLRLKPHESVEIAHCFTAPEELGEGVFSVYFYNNLVPEVERKLKASGIPFVLEVNHSLGKISVQASNPQGGASGRQPFSPQTNRTPAASRRSP